MNDLNKLLSCFREEMPGGEEGGGDNADTARFSLGREWLRILIVFLTYSDHRLVGRTRDGLQ